MKKCNDCDYDLNKIKVKSCNKCNAFFKLSKLTEKFFDEALKICNDNKLDFYKDFKNKLT
jgi:hypothetical protein